MRYIIWFRNLLRYCSYAFATEPKTRNTGECRVSQKDSNKYQFRVVPTSIYRQL